MKVTYLGRNKNVTLSGRHLSKDIEVKNGVIENMSEEDFKAVIANGDNADLFKAEKISAKKEEALIKRAEEEKQAKLQEKADKIKALTKAAEAAAEHVAKCKEALDNAKNPDAAKTLTETFYAAKEAAAKAQDAVIAAKQ